MTRSRRLAALAVAVLLGALALFGPAASTASTPYAFAVIGDVPYGSAQTSVFPDYISRINADADVRLVSHLGDISSPLDCSSTYYSTVRSHFDRFADPLVYTPGDNEWADCWKAPVGAGEPLDRLAALRSTFFPVPGTSLGNARIPVTAQPAYPENVTFAAGAVTFAVFHAVGSSNDLLPWYGAPEPSPAQAAEATARIDAAVHLISDAFTRARASASRAVVLITQADMFLAGQGPAYVSGFQDIVRAIAAGSRSFAKPVFLINGDSHNYRADSPLTSPTWLTYYGLRDRVANLTRITIMGGTGEWTKFTVEPTSSVLSWQRMPFP
jgi:hypothetical protein